MITTKYLAAQGERLLDHAVHVRGRRRDHDELRRLGEVAHGGRGRDAQDRGALPVHQRDRTAVAPGQRALRQPVSPLAWVGRGADDRDRTRVEETRQRVGVVDAEATVVIACVLLVPSAARGCGR